VKKLKKLKKISKSVNNSFENYNKDGINPIEKRKTEKEQLRKYIKVKSAFRKQMVEVFQKENHEELGIIHKNATPGPGYYNSSKGFEVSNKYRFIPQENYQFFGSLSERFGQQIGINEDIIGPGTYFNIKTNLNNKNSKKTKIPFGVKTTRFIQSAKISQNPGPNIYNPEKIQGKKIMSKKTIFSTSSKRFIESAKRESNPGPCNYFNTDKDSDGENNITKYKFSAPFKASKRKPLLNSKPEDIPPIGWYNPDFLYNMSYNVGKKAYKPSLQHIPFNSMKKRFDEGQFKINDVGPGHYFKESKNPKMGTDVPFSTKDGRFRSSNKHEYMTAPGSYNLNGHFDWNIKTYNINFL